MITGSYNHVSMYMAVCLKLTALQMLILDVYIQNWIAGHLIAYDYENPKNKLFYFNVYFWAKTWGISKARIKKALLTLTKPIMTTDGISIQILFTKRTCRGIYVGMSLDILHVLIADNYKFFNTQCIRHNRSELQYFPAGLIHDMRESTNEKAVIINDMESVFQIEDKTETEKEPDTWTESLVRELCVMADNENALIYRNGKSVKVFSHLKDGEFKKRRRGVDLACELIGDLYTGRFFRKNPVHSLFGDISQEHLEFKNVKLAVERIMCLKGNKEGIRKFILKCARNYFIACKPGQETYREVKANFPVTVKDFILFDSYKGNHVANFLLFYSSTMSAKDKQAHHTMIEIKKAVPQSVFKLLCEYEDYVLENQIQSFWLCVYRLTKKIKKIIDDGATSYSMPSCFDIVFKKVNDISEYHKKVLPGYFDPEQKTASDALIEMKDK